MSRRHLDTLGWWMGAKTYRIANGLGISLIALAVIGAAALLGVIALLLEGIA